MTDRMSPVLVVTVFIWLAAVYYSVLGLYVLFVDQTADAGIFAYLVQGAEKTRGFAPPLVIVLFAICLVLIGIRIYRAWSESSAVAQLSGFETLPGDESNIPRSSLAGKRLAFALQCRKNGGLTFEQISSRADEDAAHLHEAYRSAHTLIWVLPVVGFMGTAWAMKDAIAGFSGALRESDNTATVVERLVQLVIPQLSEAFLITVFALGCTAVAYWCASVIQGWEQRLLARIDALSVGWVSSGSQSGSPEAVLAPLVVAQGLQKLAEHLQATKRYAEELSRSLGVIVQELHGARQDIQRIGAAVGALQHGAQTLQAGAQALAETATARYRIVIEREDARR